MNLLLLFSLFSVIHSVPDQNLPIESCGTANFSNYSPYKGSLVNLFSRYSSVTQNVSKFLYTSEGTDSDRVYGLFWCYAYSPDIECLKCLKGALVHIQKLCPNNSEALVWENDFCQFRYSTQDFYGQLNATGKFPTRNQKNVTEPETFRHLVNDTLLNLTKVAAFNPSSNDHAERGTLFMPNSLPVYAFVQCTKDLTPGDCNLCLENATKDLLDVFYFAKGARLLSRSCFLRYEFYEFYKGINVSNNSVITPKPEPKANRAMGKWMIAVIAIASGILLLSAVGCCVCLLNQKRRERTSGNQDMRAWDEDDSDNLQQKLDPKEFPFIEMKILQAATNGFSDCNKLGEGGFGPVFKGTLPDGQEIAVKRLSFNSRQGSEEFVNEVLLIHKLQHVNLVRLLGFSVQGVEKLLIYEYMTSGGLDRLLDLQKRAQLDWSTRLRIINGVSRGMLYLHQDSRLNIIHRDLKPSNVQLDANMNPKISDFGIARIFGGSDSEADTSKIAGTYGYMSPEFAMEGVYSIKSDVFSFGVLLLEIITGKQNAGFHVTRLASSLLAYAWKLWKEDRGHELMDRLLTDSCPEEEFLRCMQIGLLCVQEDAHDRPSMPSVVLMLNEENVVLMQPERPAFNVGRFNDHYQTCVDNLSMNGLTISDVLPR